MSKKDRDSIDVHLLRMGYIIKSMDQSDNKIYQLEGFEHPLLIVIHHSCNEAQLYRLYGEFLHSTTNSLNSSTSNESFDYPSKPKDGLKVDLIFWIKDKLPCQYSLEQCESTEMMKRHSPSRLQNFLQGIENKGTYSEDISSSSTGNNERYKKLPNILKKVKKDRRTSGGAGAISYISNNHDERLRIFGRNPVEIWPDGRISESLLVSRIFCSAYNPLKSMFAIVCHLGSEVEGIFRRCCVKNQVDAMKEIVDNSDEVIKVSACPPLVAATVLKQYFAKIPTSILGNENWNEWQRLMKNGKLSERVKLAQR
ncbi:hypothetical protein Ciccas_004136 [Cichlidogyrus casuarinus]|uniref:Rho-GAP domain-containing protein n=1 Tax=Cichlidogyrus casuarinus TaxID=1844966 RepID=A0ABD2QCB1_9PLAT